MPIQKKHMITETFDCKKVIKEVENTAWNKGTATRKFASVGENVSLIFQGYVHEPIYEYFTSGCDVYAIKDGVKECLYSSKIENSSVDNIEKFIQGNMKIGFVEV